MKARLLTEKEIHAESASPELLAQCERRGDHVFAPPGTIIDHRDAFWIVKMGQAEPADDECAVKVGMSAEQFASAQHAARRLAAGITQQDYPLFDAGYISGYDAEGNFKPGPNWDQYQATVKVAEETDEGL